MNRLHEFTLILDDSELEKVYQRYAELESLPVNGEFVEQIERDLGAKACAAIKIELRLAAALMENDALKTMKRDAE